MSDSKAGIKQVGLNISQDNVNRNTIVCVSLKPSIALCLSPDTETRLRFFLKLLAAPHTKNKQKISIIIRN